MARIILGVCGSVAAIEAPKLARALKREGAEVQCMMTKAAKKVIHPDVLEWASENRVVEKLTGECEHISMCGTKEKTDLVLIYPASANTISKIACGIADNAVTTAALAAIGAGIKVAAVPAMHLSMYENPFIKENIKRLKENGIMIIEPRIEEGKAKVESFEEVAAKVLKWI